MDLSTRMRLYWLPALLFIAPIWFLSSLPGPRVGTAFEPVYRAHPSPSILVLGPQPWRLRLEWPKVGHVIGYIGLGASLFYALRRERARKAGGGYGETACSVSSTAGLAVLLAGAYAVSDELHQSFVPGRTAALSDVALDGAAALAGVVSLVLVWWVARCLRGPGRKRRTAMVLSLALVLRLAVVFWLGPEPVAQTWEYGMLASNLLEGRGYTVEAPYGGLQRSWMPPGYPALMILLQWAMDGRMGLSLQLVQVGLSTASVGLLGALAARLLGARAESLASLLMAVYPPLIAKVAYADPVTLETFLLVLVLWLVARLPQGRALGSRSTEGTVRPGLCSLADGALVGTALGFLVLTRPTFLVFAAALLGWLAWLGIQNFLDRDPAVTASGRACLGLVLALALVVGPWTARNWVVHRELVLVSTNGGFNFYVGNGPEATGDAYAVTGEPVWTRMPDSLRAELARRSEPDQDRLLYAQGWRTVAADPGRFLTLCARRLGWFWWFRPRAGSGQLVYPPWWTTGYRLVWGGVLAAAAVGAWAARTAWRPLLPLALAILSQTMVYTVFFVHTRYRMVLEPGLLLLAAVGVQAVLDRFRSGRPRAFCRR